MIGIGGLGHMAIQLLHAVSPARVIAVDIDEEKLALARAVGAEETLPANGSATAAIGELTNGLGAMVVLDCVGSEQTMKLAAAAARAGGAVLIIGLAGGTLPFGFGTLPFDCTIAVPYWGSVVELMEVLELARRGEIHVHTERFPLARVAEAYARLRSGTIQGRAVVTPHG